MGNASLNGWIFCVWLPEVKHICLTIFDPFPHISTTRELYSSRSRCSCPAPKKVSGTVLFKFQISRMTFRKHRHDDCHVLFAKLSSCRWHVDQVGIMCLKYLFVTCSERIVVGFSQNKCKPQNSPDKTARAVLGAPYMAHQSNQSMTWQRFSGANVASASRAQNVTCVGWKKNMGSPYPAVASDQVFGLVSLGVRRWTFSGSIWIHRDLWKGGWTWGFRQIVGWRFGASNRLLETFF